MTTPTTPIPSFVTVHPIYASHDRECPVSRGADPSLPGMRLHYRVTRPHHYPLYSPGHTDPAARQGHYTDACCAPQAASVVMRRLTIALKNRHLGERYVEEPFDVQAWGMAKATAMRSEPIWDDPNGCPHCGEPRRERQCYQCHRIGLLVDCGHMGQPRPIAAGKVDGSDGRHDYCNSCANGDEP